MYGSPALNKAGVRKLEVVVTAKRIFKKLLPVRRSRKGTGYTSVLEQAAWIGTVRDAGVSFRHGYSFYKHALGLEEAIQFFLS